MSYLAIYRRFRPDSFEKMVGQEQVVKTLVNQIKTDRIGHAYLFCGARGTGKTTAAKIFARAINCLDPVDGSPCGRCEACKKLADPQNLDILEIDAASNNKVDNVREIRDKIQYPPVAGKYKVYIIDEAHMLTSEAFNALLKTLEEPPKHAVIIMATTEPHKLPATILSRCMRFDFRLVPEKVIADHIKKIYDELGKTYEEEAITEIARAGEGSVRDALSVADTCLSFSEGKLTYRDVVEVLGTADGEKTYELVKSILCGKVGETLESINGLVSVGKSVALLSRDLSVTMRNLLVVKTCGQSREVLSMPQEKFDRLKELADLCDEHRIFRAEEIFAGVENDLKYTTNSRVVFETAAVKATLSSADYNIDALIARIAKLEKALAQGGFSASAAAQTAAPNHLSAKTAFKEDKENAEKVERSEQPVRQVEKDLPRSEDYPPVSDELPPETATVNDGYGDAAEEPIAEPVGNMGEERMVEPIKEEWEAEPSPVAKTDAKPVGQTSSPKFSDARIWGVVIRRLRADKNIMLWIACQEQEARTQGDNFCIFVEGDNEYNLISKPENVEIIKNIVSEMTPLGVKIVKKGEPIGDGFEDDINKAREILGDIKIEN